MCNPLEVKCKFQQFQNTLLVQLPFLGPQVYFGLDQAYLAVFYFTFNVVSRVKRDRINHL